MLTFGCFLVTMCFGLIAFLSLKVSIEENYETAIRNLEALKILNDWLEAETGSAGPVLFGHNLYDNIPPANPTHVMCGGCGSSVVTLDGFNAAAHGCQGIDASLTENKSARLD